MKTKDFRFQEARQYAFEDVFPALFLPIKQLFKNASAESDPHHRSALLASSCTMIFVGMRTMARFYSFGTGPRDDLESFVQRYFPSSYRWQFKKLYRAYEQGIFYYLGHKRIVGQPVIFTLAKEKAAFSETAEGVFEVNVEKLFEDFMNAVKNFKLKLQQEDSADNRISFCYCYEKIKSACLTEWK